MSIIEHMAKDIENKITGQLRNAFDDPDLELDKATKQAIKTSLRKQQRRVKDEIDQQEKFEKNCLPGLMEALHDA